MRVKTLLLLGMFLLPPYTGRACFSYMDQWAAGVLLNNGEPTAYAALEPLGTDSRHFLKTRDNDSLVIYKYRGHYDPLHTMVQLGWYRLNLTDVFPELVVLLDTTQDRETFDFAQAVGTELAWLADQGIIGMTPDARQEAVESLAVGHSGNSRYWTQQRQVLQYNWFFVYDSASGSWTGMGAYRNGCGMDATFELPPEELGVVTIGNYARISALVEDYQVGPNPFRSTLTFICHQPARADIYDRSGRLVRVLKLDGKPVAWNGRDFHDRTLPAGMYYCRIDLGQIQLTHTVLKIN
jgi:hypothetical protein